MNEYELVSSELLNSDRNWEEDYHHENGRYMNRCIECKEVFIGNKRRMICKICFKEDYQ